MIKVARKITVLALCFCALLSGCGRDRDELTVIEAKSIAEEAYIYAYPMMQNYKTMYLRAIKGQRGFNNLTHRHKLLGPDFTAIVGPNNDTLYSSVWLDLRAEPYVITVPEVPDNRYYSIQFIDMFVHNFAYIGQRETGSTGGTYIIAGPNTSIPKSVEGVDRIYYAESEFVFAIGRILAKSGLDQSIAADLQRQYTLQPLSSFLGQAAKPAAPELNFPVYDAQRIKTVQALDLFNYLLGFVEIHKTEQELFKRFEKIGVFPGSHSGFKNMPVEIQQAIREGINSAYAKIVAESELIGAQVEGWNTTYKGFGPRAVMQDKFLLRAAAAMIALYGNDKEENSSFSRQVDHLNTPLDGLKSEYTLRFEKDQFPPAEAFWSLTMYRLPEVLLFENPIQRYSIGDRTQGLKYAADGSLTLYVQHKPPLGEHVSNWLPAPAGPFAVALRLYLPDPVIHSGEWLPPQFIRKKMY